MFHVVDLEKSAYRKIKRKKRKEKEEEKIFEKKIDWLKGNE